MRKERRHFKPESKQKITNTPMENEKAMSDRMNRRTHMASSNTKLSNVIIRFFKSHVYSQYMYLLMHPYFKVNLL